ncbi:Ada metal-binding domain-containing protein [Demequina salsinemoris]|uniref:Ada metal-binding domain-containing protein n=1 Tax=Demequina salsinemoris TaxID=577470 RepID=UPI0007818A3C|nr:Ada metal-binding domain-containing protein [Demequina salsinemoris]
MWDDDTRYAVIRGRDARYDGQFFTAVLTTGIYCRPSCPARTPARQNVRFYRTAAAAQSAGFRSCRRCRPEAVPGSPDWDVTGDVAARAMRLIDDGVVDREGVDGLSARLGYSRRQLQRILVDELGAPPLALANAHRLHSARALLEHTDLPLTQVALTAGFGSVRQFNDAARGAWGMTPSEARGRRARSTSTRAVDAAPTVEASAATGGSVGTEASGDGGTMRLELRLATRAPFDGERVLAFLAARAIDGVETVEPGSAHVRTLTLHHGPARARLVPVEDGVRVGLDLADPRDLGAAVSRCRALLDLDADPIAVREALVRDDRLAGHLAVAPGLRVPGSVDRFEAMARAIVGQQVSVSGARRSLAAIAERWGRRISLAGGAPSLLMPTPEVLADVDPEVGLMPASRWRALSAVARAVADGHLDVSPGADRHQVRQRLLAIPGIGPWTADYVMLRGYGDPDAFPGTDLVLRKELGAAARDVTPVAERWRPWRAYAAQHLWTANAEGRGHGSAG